MSSSFVPKISLSKGTARKNKFDLSTSTHTTAEVGYFQPTYSKLLMPNSDLKVRVSDSILMSSLVVPTFGDLFLRHWFTATPVSSLWSPLGAYMTGRDYTDLDSPTKYGKYICMPQFSTNEILSTIKARGLDGSNTTASQASYGNAIYLIDKLDLANNSNYRYWSEILSSFEQTSLSHNKSGLLEFLSSMNLYGYEYVQDGRTPHYKPNKQSEIKDRNSLYRLPFDLRTTGVVINNTDSWVKRSLDAAGNPTIPSPSECPYLLLRFGGGSNMDNFFPASFYEDNVTGAHSGDVYANDMYITPLTLKMYQGDEMAFKNYESMGFPLQTIVTNLGGSKNVLRPHWSSGIVGAPFALADDDAYFTGDLSKSKFDFGAYVGGTIASVTDMYKVYCNYGRRYKRLRKLFIGLGYQFNPHDVASQLPWKFMAYYKSWFDMFYPHRDVQYNHTCLARLVNFMSYHSSCCDAHLFDNMFTKFEYYDLESNLDVDKRDSYMSVIDDFIELFFACADARYLMRTDYYSLADPTPDSTDETHYDYYGYSDGPLDEWQKDLPNVNKSNIASDLYGFSPLNELRGTDSVTRHDPDYGWNFDGWSNKLATKMLTYLTKKRLVGKNVSDTMRAIFGAVDEHDKAHESTWCFGNTQTPIKVSAVMSQAETEEMHLGDYAGRGLGGSTSKTYSIDNNGDLLVVICLSAIVPRLSYYQGHTRENLIGASPNDFCKPMWDGVGYDDVRASEYIADYDNPDFSLWKNRQMSEINSGALGLVPRYTWYKVNGHDTLNGDMSLASLKDSMSPYVLTREVSNNFGLDQLSMRTIDPDTFNKIFNESSSLDDHFIIQALFNVDMYAPLKSISTSFETFDEDEDGTIEVEKA